MKLDLARPHEEWPLNIEKDSRCQQIVCLTAFQFYQVSSPCELPSLRVWPLSNYGASGQSPKEQRIPVISNEILRYQCHGSPRQLRVLTRKHSHLHGGFLYQSDSEDFLPFYPGMVSNTHSCPCILHLFGAIAG